jgi:hypothetical protein
MLKLLTLASLLTLLVPATADGATTNNDTLGVTEGVVEATFVPEATMKADLLQMLARFAQYLVAQYEDLPAASQGQGPAYGHFRSRSSLQANEDGVRTNADLCMVTAFLCRYGRGQVKLPAGISWEQLQVMAHRSLAYATATHKSNSLVACKGNRYWGSTSRTDHQWESSLWAMSVAYAAFFQWDSLNTTEKGQVERLLKAECRYELQRDIPTGYRGDTKAEENGWEADVLAATLGLFPDDPLAPQWFERLRLFAINSYSHSNDANDTTCIDPGHDGATVAQLYRGANLYDDYTLQNHDFFHTSYQNVVIQELGEAALALKLFQQGLHGHERWQTRALTHHCLDVQHRVLDWLALADGELAMPNGNDWSLFLYDQITSYSYNATLLRDPDALMLENRAYKMLKARQLTTPDGSWLLRSDIGPRRMGVEAHRVMMTWLMHDMWPTADLKASDFEDFRQRHSQAMVFKSQNIVRSYTPQRFATFSWATGIKNYTGYVTANSFDRNKVVVPFKAHNTGNFLGWYEVEGRHTNAVPTLCGAYSMDGDAWAMNGALLTNDSTLSYQFALYAPAGNAVMYVDRVEALRPCTINAKKGGLMAISVDPFTRPTRTLTHAGGQFTTDGEKLSKWASTWVNVDHSLGIAVRTAPRQIANNPSRLQATTSALAGTMAFGERRDNNSILTALLYPCFDDQPEQVEKGQLVDERIVVYYNNVSPQTTDSLDRELIDLRQALPEGWNGVLAADPDGSRHLLITQFGGQPEARLKLPSTPMGYPVLREPSEDGWVTVSLAQDRCLAESATFFIKGENLRAFMSEGSKDEVVVESLSRHRQRITVTAITQQGMLTDSFTVKSRLRVSLADGHLVGK